MAEGEGAEEFQIEIQKVEVQKESMIAAVNVEYHWMVSQWIHFPSPSINAGHLHFIDYDSLDMPLP
jgi:hypothetical protein